MTFDFYGTKELTDNDEFNELVAFIEQEEHTGWEFHGMNVELDPTVYYNDKSIKLRWLDLDEGFNDKMILRTKKKFFENFKKVV